MSSERTYQHPSPNLGSDDGKVARYTCYSVYSRTGEGADPETTAREVEQYIAELAEQDVIVRGFYDVSEFRAGADLLIWSHAPNAKLLQQAGQKLRRLEMAKGLTLTWTGIGVHRAAEFSKQHAPAFMFKGMEPKEWLTVYPFVRSYDWYLLPEEERMKMLREHGMLGRDFPQVLANTVACFSLNDYEWLLAFEADELHDLVDMMRHLRYSEARLHVRDELPFHTGRRITPAEVGELLR